MRRKAAWMQENAGLQLRGLTRRFGAVVAVDGVDLDVPAGQMLGVIGRSGAGKSTLLRMINRLQEPSSGTIRFGQTDVTALRGRALRDWRAACAMIFQQFNLVPRLDVLTNVLIGRLNHRATLPSLFGRFSRRRAGDGDEAAGPLRPGRCGVAARRHPVRRAAAARGDLPRAVAGAAPAAGRRADRQPRSAQFAAGDGCAADGEPARRADGAGQSARPGHRARLLRPDRRRCSRAVSCSTARRHS